MVTAEKSWRCWSGTRGELVRAIETATSLVSEEAGFPAEASLEVKLKGGISEAGDREALATLHGKELSLVRTVIATIEVPFDTWQAAAREARETGNAEPERPQTKISIRVTPYVGVSLDISTSDRVHAEGMRTRLIQTMQGGATNSPGFPREAFWLAAGPLALGGVIGGVKLAEATSWAAEDNKWQTAEIVGMVLGPLLAVGAAMALWWMFPPVEIFEDGGAGRFRRWRARLGGALIALVVGLVAAFIYDKA